MDPAGMNVANDPFLTHQGNVTTKPKPAGTSYFAKPKAGPKQNGWFVSMIGKPIPIFLCISTSFAFLWSLAPAIPIAMVFVSFVWTTNVALSHSVFGLQQSRAFTSAELGARVSEKITMEGFWLQCLATVLAIVLGTLTGLYAFESYTSTFYTIVFGREYSDVLASSQGVQYADAGKMVFSDTSTVDTAMGVGYRDKYTYCVAPVMDSGVDQARSVGFWAIGYDCCGSRGDFECGGAGDGTAHGGVRAPPDGMLDRSHGEFMRAVHQAAAVWDLVPDEHPILLHWVRDPVKEQWNALTGTCGVIALGMALFTLLVIVMSAASHLSSGFNGAEGQAPQMGRP